MIFLSLLVYFQSQHALYDRTTSELSRLTKIEKDTWLNNRSKDINVVVGAARIRSMQPDQAKAAIDLYYKEWGIYETIFLVGLDGKSIATSDNQVYDLSDREYIRLALNGQANTSQPVFSKASGHAIIVVAAPVVSENKIVGAAGATINMDNIKNLLSDSMIGESGEAYLVNQEGYFITSSRFEDKLKAAGKIQNQSILEYKVDTEAIKNLQSGKSGLSEYNGYLGNAMLGSYTWINNQKWGLIIEQSSSEAFSEINSLRNILIFFSVVLTLIVLFVAFMFSKNISSPISNMAQIAREMAQGNIHQEIKNNSRDEIGELSRSFRMMIDYQQNMASSANLLADGDLTIQVNALSEDDILGNTFVRMVQQLRAVMQQVAANTHKLTGTSGSLAQAAAQAGEATNQIAKTMQQVARGTTQQTEGTTHSAASIEQLNRVINTIALGSQAQSQAFTSMDENSQLLSNALQTVTENTNAVSSEVINAGDTAGEGQDIVNQTVETMKNIHSSVKITAQKVAEMSQRSEQIGAILATIEDIAGQTNMLALNAAIEAARAGEHGTGFAVVADEVRKLAEKAGASTREVNNLVKSIQNTVGETINAMNESSAQVEQGSTRALLAGQALEKILSVTNGIKDRSEQVIISVAEMGKISTNFFNMIAKASVIAGENTRAAAEISSRAAEIMHSIENIASVSEENSAAVEEVSASSEEMSAQVKEVGDSAQTLAEMVQQLQVMIAHFKLT
ncbi:MAG: methyl-accepting chemotaxis protein [Anaerolineae bacterium]|nr:methyl-accepting chemotaxis protein [Anaerolineae bacterium]